MCVSLEKVVGFIDGIVLRTARTGVVDTKKRTVYNGNERKHALKVQAITTTDGPLIYMNTPRRHGNVRQVKH